MPCSADWSDGTVETVQSNQAIWAIDTVLPIRARWSGRAEQTLRPSVAFCALLIPAEFDLSPGVACGSGGLVDQPQCA
jgi:hypothetical protein